MFINRVSHHLVFNRTTCRIVAIGLFAFPEPVVSDALGLTLLAVSFLLPELNPDLGRASSCGCDFHRFTVREPRVLGNGALVQVRRFLAPKLTPHERYHLEPYGFGPIVLPGAEPVGTMHSNTSIRRESPYSWHKLPKLEGALLRKLSGYGCRTAVRCEVSRA